MIYINSIYQNQKETVDQAATRKEAKQLLLEYMMCMPEHALWLSQRACKGWK